MTATPKIQHVALTLVTDRNPNSLTAGHLRLEVQEASLSVCCTLGAPRPARDWPGLGCTGGGGRGGRRWWYVNRGHSRELSGEVLPQLGTSQLFPLYRYLAPFSSSLYQLPLSCSWTADLKGRISSISLSSCSCFVNASGQV